MGETTVDNQEIEVGDTVWVGVGKVHWTVLAINPQTDRYRVQSQHMGSRTWVDGNKLKLHTKGQKTP